MCSSKDPSWLHSTKTQTEAVIIYSQFIQNEYPESEVEHDKQCSHVY